MGGDPRCGGMGNAVHLCHEELLWSQSEAPQPPRPSQRRRCGEQLRTSPCVRERVRDARRAHDDVRHAPTPRAGASSTPPAIPRSSTSAAARAATATAACRPPAPSRRSPRASRSSATAPPTSCCSSAATRGTRRSAAGTSPAAATTSRCSSATTAPARSRCSRPAPASGLTTGGNDVNHLFIQGIHLNASSRDAGTGDYARQRRRQLRHPVPLQARRPHHRRLRDRELPDQHLDPAVLRPDHRRRRSAATRSTTLVDARAAATRQGLYVQGVNGIQLMENVFDHNGWNENASGSKATIFNHNTYMRADNDNVVVIGNVFSNASSHGLQARSGGDHQEQPVPQQPDPPELRPGQRLAAQGRRRHRRGQRQRLPRQPRHRRRRPRLGHRDRQHQATAPAPSSTTTSSPTTPRTPAPRSCSSTATTSTTPAQATGLHDLTIENNVVYKWNTGLSIMRRHVRPTAAA